MRVKLHWSFERAPSLPLEPHCALTTPFSFLPRLVVQAEDCQQMFLHPVNVRCLLREYGSLEASPDSITARVVETEGHTVTEVAHQT